MEMLSSFRGDKHEFCLVADDLQLQMSAPQIEYLSYFTLFSHA